jgi:hypothetical protein
MVGAWHRQVLGAAILVFSIYFWFMRDTEKVIAKRFLFASGLCFSLNALVLIKASVIDGVTALPIPPFVKTENIASIALLEFVTAYAPEVRV